MAAIDEMQTKKIRLLQYFFMMTWPSPGMNHPAIKLIIALAFMLKENHKRKSRVNQEKKNEDIFVFFGKASFYVFLYLLTECGLRLLIESLQLFHYNESPSCEYEGKQYQGRRKYEN